MNRGWIGAAAVGGFVSVAAGAVAAHLAARDGHAAELLRTGALYGMVHAAALVGVTAIAERRPRPGLALAVAGWGFALGLLLFSSSLFALAVTGIAAIGWATPFGGAALLLGWAALGIDALRRVADTK
jgi:uncharacterized membrane protein YgdD (TMEM256/DUF423 family)